MTEVGSAYLTIMPSARGFATSLGAQIGPAFTAAGATGAGQVATGMTAAGPMGKMKGAGKALAGGLLAGFAAMGVAEIAGSVTRWIGDSISLASDLEQSMGAVDAIFDENSSTIHSWAAGAAQDLGLSQSAYSQLATVIGAQLKNMGFSLDEATTRTNDLITVGADLAATYGGTTAEAVNALSSVLRGEYDTIERYGVSINQATINAKMAELGLDGLTGEALRNAQAQAALALVADQTADAQGRFAAESDTLAGKQQRLNAEFENMQTEVGSALLPVVVELFDVFQQTGLPMLQALVGWITENKDQIEKWGTAIITAGLGFAEVMLNMAALAASMASAVIGGLRLVWDFFSAFVQSLLDGAAEAFGWVPGLGDKLQTAADDFAAFSADADASLADVQDSANEMADEFSSAAGEVGELRDAINSIPSRKSVIVAVTTQGDVVRAVGDGSYRVGNSAISYRASGGPVVAGRPYIVGEREAELFVPDQSGHIYNQAQLAAMAGSNDGAGLTQYIYPTPGMSEMQVGQSAAAYWTAGQKWGSPT